MVKPSQLSFKTLCDFFAATASARGLKRKTYLLQSLLEKNLERDSEDLFAVVRLILPRVGRPLLLQRPLSVARQQE